VKNGQHVTTGQTIGLIGSTGRSTGPHLHYETRINDSAVDPMKFLRAGEKLSGL
jgi:murein DD-endopeptidase MepM/ murein hydrolase activator NlpD